MVRVFVTWDECRGMSLAPRDPTERARIMTRSKAHFRAAGWTIDDLTKGHGHFLAQKGVIKILVSCHDSRSREFFGSPAILHALTAKARAIKLSRHMPTIFVFTSHLIGVSLEDAAEAGIYLFTLEELDLVSELHRLLTDLPSDLERRQILLVEQLLHLCLSIADRFHKAGDRARAIEWARHAVDGAERYTVAHEKLFNFLVEAGHLDQAASLARDVLKIDPDNAFMLRGMKALSERPGAGGDGEDWGERIAQANRRAAAAAASRPSLDSILQKQAVAAPRPDRSPASPDPPSPVPPASPVARLIRRIFSGIS
jgi:hypothetical protein